LFFSANRWNSGSRLLFSEPESSIRSAPPAPPAGALLDEVPLRAQPTVENASSTPRTASARSGCAWLVRRLPFAGKRERAKERKGREDLPQRHRDTEDGIMEGKRSEQRWPSGAHGFPSSISVSRCLCGEFRRD